VVFVANPNNPTGTWAPAAELEAFIAALPPHVLVALDEAYFEYIGGCHCRTESRGWLAIPISSCSALFQGLWSGRRSRGLCRQSSGVADMLNRVRQAFNVSTVGLAGAAAALDDPAHVAAAVKVAVAERARVAASLRSMGTPVVPSAGNFLLLHAGANARQRFEDLLRKGIIVRPVGNYQLPEHLRVTLGTVEQNDRFCAPGNLIAFG
jgi:histidinol-phosphate aminotransferase